MVNINLLPKYYTALVKSTLLALGSLVIIVFLHFTCQATILEKKEKINVLKKEIQKIDSEISIQSSKDLHFRPLKQNQNFDQLKLLRKLSSTIPIGLYLTEVSMTKNNYILVGYCEKIAIISDWANRLTRLQFNLSLQEIRIDKESNDFPIRFILLVKT